VFIDFEGIDGSGKTTLSNLLAARLRRLGHKVAHAREGGELQSPIARRIRELTRDSRLLEMGARTEFFLNVARDAQQLEEVIAPALARGEVCISDRYLYSQLALSGGGRNLPLSELEPVCAMASKGIWPDLVILVDVEPDLARLRKRLGKLKDGRSNDSDSRKGLVGAGLAVRVREAFLEMARKDPSRWLIIENNDQPLWVLEQRIVDAVVARLEGRDPQVQRIIPVSPVVPGPVTVDSVEERFFNALDSLEVREPSLAVWMLGGLPGLAAHQRRLAAVERFPGLAVRSLAGLEDEASWALRELLAKVVPVDVATSLGSSTSPRAMALREQLYPLAPGEVLAGLKRNDSAEAWALRERGLQERRLTDVLLSLAGVDGATAVSIRELGMQKKLYSEVARSLTGLSGERADALREVLLKHDRLAVLRSINGLHSPFASGLRAQLAGKALKLVLRSLTGLTTEESFVLREHGAPLTKEAIDSLDGLDDPRAWQLREAYAERWPATVLSSLKGLPLSARAEALIIRILSAGPSRLPLLRNAYSAIAISQELPTERTPRPVISAEPRVTL
jgi:dTMP kinase